MSSVAAEEVLDMGETVDWLIWAAGAQEVEWVVH